MEREKKVEGGGGGGESRHTLEKGIPTHVPPITGRVWSPLHYQGNRAGCMANLDKEW